MTDPKHSPITDGGARPDAAAEAEAPPPRASATASAGDSTASAPPPARRRDSSGPIPLRGGEPVTIVAADGARLHGELLLPPGEPPRVVVALSHAMMVDRRTLDVSGRAAGRLAAPLARPGARPPGSPASAASPAAGGTAQETGGILTELVRAGVAVLWFDQRGHGQSGPTPTQGGRWDYDDLVADAGAVASYLRTRLPAAKRVAVGHSLFAHVALAYQAQTEQRLQVPALYAPMNRGPAALYDGLVIIGGNVWLRQLEPSWNRFLRKRLSYEALLLLGRPLGYLPVRRLGIGTADEPAAYLLQMGQWLRRGDWTDRSGRSYLAALPHVRSPILSIAGAGDRLMAVPSCQLALVRRTAGPVTHWLIGKEQGDALDPGHMDLVLDARLRPRWRALARWVRALGEASAPSGGA